MKFLYDVHISYAFSKYLKDDGYDSTHVNFILQKWYTKDSEISQYADLHDLILITKDMDFKNSHFLKNTPKKLIRIILGNISNEDMIGLFIKNKNLILNLSLHSKFHLEIAKESVYSIS